MTGMNGDNDEEHPATMPITDLHAHYLAPSVIRRLRGGDAEPHIRVEDAGDSVRFAFPSSVSRTLEPRMADVVDRLRHLDECGIDIQVLSTWIDMFGYDLPEDVAVRYHTWINEGLAQAVDDHPDRLRFFASVPLPWSDAAVSVLRDAVRRLGAVGAMIGTNVCGSNLDDPRLSPFWAQAEALDVPVQLHPVDPAGADRLTDHQLANFLGNPFDTTVAAASLILGGVLDRHPRLRVVLVHGGGYLPYAVGRIGHGRRARNVASTLAREPVDYLDRFTFDTVVYEPRVLRVLSGLVGSDHLVLGSDYPFDMEPPDVVNAVRSALGEEALAQTARNAARLLDRDDPTVNR
jgi:aminocarboxymuconate-semialdehyde decarboxylase